jgi:hypothetical protein
MYDLGNRFLEGKGSYKFYGLPSLINIKPQALNLTCADLKQRETIGMNRGRMRC